MLSETEGNFEAGGIPNADRAINLGLSMLLVSKSKGRFSSSSLSEELYGASINTCYILGIIYIQRTHYDSVDV